MIAVKAVLFWLLCLCNLSNCLIPSPKCFHRSKVLYPSSHGYKNIFLDSSATNINNQVQKIPLSSRLVHGAKNVIFYPKRKVDQLKKFFEVQLPMFQYVWPKDDIRLRLFLVLALVFMFFGKWFNLQVPFILQRAIDNLGKLSTSQDLVKAALPNFSQAIIFYGIARAMSVVCSEIKTCLFAHVSQNVLRKFANQIFSHLHSLDSSFHLQTPSGVVSVAYVRAIRGFQGILFQCIFSVAPTILELIMVSTILYKKFGMVFASITLTTFSFYLLFTVWVTQWRVKLRKELVNVDNTRNGFLIDSILNHEVVKLFTNEKRELGRFDSYLGQIQKLSIDSTYSIAILNFGQAAIFCAGLTTSLLIALNRVLIGAMSVGDLIAVNSLLLQLSVPFNFMGYTYQELRQAYVDMGFMIKVLGRPASLKKPKILPTPSTKTENTTALLEKPIHEEFSVFRSLDEIQPRLGPSSVEFRNISFCYANGTMPISANNMDDFQFLNPGSMECSMENMLLDNVSFKVEAGQNVAIVGPSGGGKSTLLKLITRMLEPHGGEVCIDGVAVDSVTLDSLRKRVAVVPQDTSLFDETIRYNIKYGNPNATEKEVETVIEQSNFAGTIAKLPEGLDTRVGERGARLSGGERQKISIARALLRDPTLILCDEVTSSVDAFAERDIVRTLMKAVGSRTTITVAHRLASIKHCDKIVVLSGGKVVEEGTHNDLLNKKGDTGVYKKMWAAQNGWDQHGVEHLNSSQISHNNSSILYESDKTQEEKEYQYSMSDHESIVVSVDMMQEPHFHITDAMFSNDANEELIDEIFVNEGKNQEKKGFLNESLADISGDYEDNEKNKDGSWSPGAVKGK